MNKEALKNMDKFENPGGEELLDFNNNDLDIEKVVKNTVRFHTIIDNPSLISEDPIEAAKEVEILDIPPIDPENQGQNLFLAGVRMEALQNQAKLTPKQETDIEGFKQNFLGELFWKIARKNSKNVRMVASVITATSMLAASCNGRVPTHTVTPEAIIPAITETYTPTPEFTPTSTFTPEPSSTPTETQTPTPSYPELPENAQTPVVDEWGRTVAMDETGFTRWFLDTEKNQWVDVKKVIQPDINDIEHYIKVNNMEEFKELVRLEKLVLTPFPANTYFPELDKVLKDYACQRVDSNEFNCNTPLGFVPEGAEPPLKFVNHVILTAGQGRIGDTEITTEQVYNPKDGSFSVLHFGRDISNTCRFLVKIGYNLDATKFLVKYDYGKDSNGVSYNEPYMQKKSCTYNVHLLLAEAGFPNAQGLKQYTDQWLSEGKVPEELEGLIISKTPFDLK